MKVTVIIPVYNVERYLARCVDSVLAAAEGLSCEIICVNDGSTDGSAEVLSRYADRVRVITKPNGGLGSARNAGLDAMTGDYVMFVDSDDFIPRHAIRRFAAVAEASDAALVVSMRAARETEPARPRTPGDGWTMRPSTWMAGKKVQYCAWNKFYRRDLVAHRRFPAGVFEDFSWTTNILCDVDAFAAISDPLYVYCTNGGAVSITRSRYSESKMRDAMAAIRRVLEHVQDTAPSAKVVSFARRQAADGLSSTVGRVYKSGDRHIAAALHPLIETLWADFPFMRRALTLKARFRLWRMRSWNMI